MSSVVIMRMLFKFWNIFFNSSSLVFDAIFSSMGFPIFTLLTGLFSSTHVFRNSVMKSAPDNDTAESKNKNMSVVPFIPFNLSNPLNFYFVSVTFFVKRTIAGKIPLRLSWMGLW